MPRVAIVIVTHNSAAEIGGCLDALVGFSSAEVEIIVIDNASADRTREEVAARGIRCLANPSNESFAAALNAGACATTAPLILSLNPDACLVSGLDAMADFLEHPPEDLGNLRIGAVGGMLIGPDGEAQRGFMARNLPTPATLIFEVLGINWLWPANPVNWHYRCLGLDPVTVSRVDQPAGAFLMFTREAWESVGGFDESFRPIWFEDVDFCARLKAAGYCAFYNSAAVAKHTGSHSIITLDMENRASYWYGNLLKYAAKHYGLAAFRTTCVAVAVGAVFRAIWGFPRSGLKAPAVYGGIVGLALGRALMSSGSRRASVV
jgi:N-acetylglucosaminyl-diphospho-decaprenol L-rhamnosyltransferase